MRLTSATSPTMTKMHPIGMTKLANGNNPSTAGPSPTKVSDVPHQINATEAMSTHRRAETTRLASRFMAAIVRPSEQEAAKWLRR